jgi:hypothetical protein
MRYLHCLLILAFLLSPLCGAEKTWKAGVAVQVVTPAESMWLSGYAARTKPSAGKEQDLYVKALALEDSAGARLVLVTSDLIGIPRGLAEAVAAEVKKRTGLTRERLMLTCSHTHCGPVLRDNLADMYDMPAAEAKKIGPYTDRLRGWMVGVVVKALGDLQPAQLSVGKGTAGFAVNRRKPTLKGIVNDANPGGPVDHDVPVLAVRSAEGKLLAVVFGYACHNTTLQFYRWCGDYAGYAQEELQKKHKGAVALFWAGCGGDANPLPRGTLERCQKYGKELAAAVNAVLAGKMAPVQGTAAAGFSFIALPYAELPSRGKLSADLLSKNRALRQRARHLVAVLDGGKKLDDHYRHYPVQVWRLGGQATWVSLGGEVVVDYSRRLKKELAGDRAVWVTAYANDVMAYIASARVLKEGGYEADSSMIYYGLPSRWAPAVEDKIVQEVHRLVKQTSAAKKE